MSAIETYFKAIIEDLAAQSEKVPVSEFRTEVTQIEGKLYAPDWFQYMIYGRGPGKQPPPDRMLAWVQKNPSLFSGSGISEKSMAFLIGRKIGREGTDVFQGKRKGIDLLGAMEKAMPDLLKDLGQEEKIKIQTSLSKAI